MRKWLIEETNDYIPPKAGESYLDAEGLIQTAESKYFKYLRILKVTEVKEFTKEIFGGYEGEYRTFKPISPEPEIKGWDTW